MSKTTRRVIQTVSVPLGALALCVIAVSVRVLATGNIFALGAIPWLALGVYSLFVSWLTLAHYSFYAVRHFCALLAVFSFLCLVGFAVPFLRLHSPNGESSLIWFLVPVILAVVIYRSLVFFTLILTEHGNEE